MTGAPAQREARASARFALRRAISLDLRSIAALRIALALSLLATLASYAGLVGDLALRHGALPLRAMRELAAPGAQWLLAPYELAPRIAVGCVFGGIALAGLSLLVGWHSRASAALAWLLLAALQARAPVLTNFGDEIMLRIAFWSCFLPLGARVALDVRRNAAPNGRSLASLASAALVLEFCAIYGVAGALKTGVEWGPEASAVHYVLGHHSMTTPFAAWLRAQHGLVAVISRATPWVELALPLLLLAPVFHAPARVLAVLALWVFHAGLSLSLNLGVFPYACIGFAGVLLPGAAWDRIARWRGRPAPAEPEWFEARTGLPLRLTAGACLALATAFAAETLWQRGDRVPLPLRRIGEALALTQPWTMYSPGVDRWDAWTSARARFADGSEIDLLRGGAPYSPERPSSDPWSREGYRGTLWIHAIAQQPRLLARPYLRKRCREWLRAHPERPIESLSLERTYVDLERADEGVRERMEVARIRCPLPARSAIATLPEFG